ncbi:HAD family phosphatase [Alkalicella caledoniensis]|uniref:HAD family phosphatase n=1 Tax=Alkalicella caledoniensis TaxID=2731377 RepID=A0A7G9W5L3_ALKCA|nr:Cof-type HAD-IIB family hydrolase [Alkalicella caledoniensis]QNO13975.1 HAD family phosphatase [Alkalicella caledoniensis]
MNNYKLICIDLDGTLLPSNHLVSERTKKTLKKAEELGIHIAISTGRSLTDAEHFAQLLGVKATVISANGAYVREKDSNEVVYKNILGEEAIWTIYDICNKYEVTPCYHTPDKIIHGPDYGRFLLQIEEKSRELGKKVIITKPYPVENLEQWKQFVEQEKDNILKCELFHEDTDRINNIKFDLRQLDQLEVVDSIREEHMEANSKGTSKGRAIEVLAGLLNIKREEIIAIGDGDNDITMIEFAGLGIAMGNAKEVLKAKASYITGSNDEDGVAAAIEKFVLKKDKAII